MSQNTEHLETRQTNCVSPTQGGNLGGSLGGTGGGSGWGTGKPLHYKSPLGLVFLEWGYLLVNP